MLTGLADSTRIMLLDSLLLVKQDAAALVAVYDLSTLLYPVVWIDNGSNETIYLKTESEFPYRSHGLSGLPNGLTIGVNGNLSVAGPILYSNMDLTDENNNDMLGLVVKEGNFTIAVDPDMVPGIDDWVLPTDSTDKTWDIKTGTNDYLDGIEVDAVIMVLDGQFQLEDINSDHYYYWPNSAVDFEIVGGYIVDGEGVTTWTGSTDTWGYLSFVTYDPRLMTRHPPFFPNTGVWDTAYWDERPDMHDVVDPFDEDWIGYDAI